jgi:hypothetical protein
MKHAVIIFISLLCSKSLVSTAQTPPAHKTDQNSASPTITFDRVWEDITPQSITITMSADGAAKYQSHNPGKTGDDIDEFETDFTISPRCRDKILRYAKDANYFNGDFTFKKHVVASTGKKTLTYADSARHFNTTYDYSENKAIQEITDIFQGISNTIEHGRKLQFLHRFDKLGLEEELKAMEDAAARHSLAELQIVAPTLESIAEDSAILNIARERAKRLLAKAKSE